MLNGILAAVSSGSAALDTPLATVAERERAVRLCEALVSETQSAALLTATVTSGANALTDRKTEVGPHELVALSPGDLAQLSGLIALYREADPSVDELLFLSEFMAGARVGHHLLARYVADAEALGASRAAVLHKTGLSETWRQVCHLAILALREIDAHIGSELPEVYVQNARVLTSLLNGARNGLKPCLNADGRLQLPPLPQRRRSPRRAFLQRCKLTVRGVETEAFVRDVSAGGLGLDRAPPLARGDQLSVELVCGRVLKGTVAWASGAAAGVRFASELKPTDPLIMV
jgi:hypothetical protein